MTEGGTFHLKFDQIGGYHHFLEAMGDTNHPEHRDTKSCSDFFHKSAIMVDNRSCVTE
jgi:hypothetical protein